MLDKDNQEIDLKQNFDDDDDMGFKPWRTPCSTSRTWPMTWRATPWRTRTATRWRTEEFGSDEDDFGFGSDDDFSFDDNDLM